MTDQEINEAVARKLGFKNLERRENIGQWDLVGHREGSPEFGETLPDYCRSIEAAWEVVERCRADKRQFHLDTTNVSWYCLIGHSQNGSLVFPGEADTAPMAICLAFLKLP